MAVATAAAPPSASPSFSTDAATTVNLATWVMKGGHWWSLFSAVIAVDTTVGDIEKTQSRLIALRIRENTHAKKQQHQSQNLLKFSWIFAIK